MTSLADKASREGYHDKAMRIALQGLPCPGALPWSPGWRSSSTRARSQARRFRDAKPPCGADGPRGRCPERRVQPGRGARRHRLRDKTARVWDAASGREITSLKGHEALSRAPRSARTGRASSPPPTITRRGSGMRPRAERSQASRATRACLERRVQPGRGARRHRLR